MNIENILQRNIDISKLSNFKTNAIASYYYEINNRHDIDNLSIILDFKDREDLDLLFISGGTNMLFAFEKYDGIVIKNNLLGWDYNKNNKVLESYSNESISDIAKVLEYELGQDLWHRFIGLPGSIGGAIFGNAGCFGLETENNFIEVEVFNFKTRQIEFLSKIDMKFSYRNSILKETGNYFIISARFDLSKKIEKYSSDVDNIEFREVKQPKGNTCGSFFKNPNREQSAGFLIESVGLKGYNLGNAFFSEKHANFLMSEDKGNYKDLLDLIFLAQDKVKKEFDIDLVPEVRIIYNK